MPSRHEPSRRAAASQAPSLTLKPSPSQAPPAVRSGTQGGGQALDRRTNTEMSARFGHDFSSIRIHTDSWAGEAAGAMGANAYALGGDIVFGAGKYNPGSRETDRLLAHELTHVVQQSQFGAGDWGRASAKGDSSEREADSLASQVMMGRSVQVQAAPGAAVARDEDGIATDENGASQANASGWDDAVPAGPAAPHKQTLAEFLAANPPPQAGGPIGPDSDAIPGGPGLEAAPAAGGIIGTAPFDPAQDAGLGQPFLAPALPSAQDVGGGLWNVATDNVFGLGLGIAEQAGVSELGPINKGLAPLNAVGGVASTLEDFHNGNYADGIADGANAFSGIVGSMDMAGSVMTGLGAEGGLMSQAGGILSSAFGTGGVAGADLAGAGAGLGGASAMGVMGAAAGAFAGGWELGKGMDWASNKLGQAWYGDDKDHSTSAHIAGGLTSVDNTLAGGKIGKGLADLFTPTVDASGKEDSFTDRLSNLF